VLEVLTGVKSTAQVCQEYEIKDTLLSRWKQEFLTYAAQVFDRGKGHELCEARIAELERLVGRVALQLQIAKKASRLLTCARDENGSW
jgi:cyclopropane fatty-acyl-phospholipid synthase-like methyltransferase